MLSLLRLHHPLKGAKEKARASSDARFRLRKGPLVLGPGWRYRSVPLWAVPQSDLRFAVRAMPGTATTNVARYADAGGPWGDPAPKTFGAMTGVPPFGAKPKNSQRLRPRRRLVARRSAKIALVALGLVRARTMAAKNGMKVRVVKLKIGATAKLRYLAKILKTQ